MKLRHTLGALVTAAAFSLAATPAFAQSTVKLGLIAEFSGPFAEYGQQIHGGMKAYMKQHGDTVAGKKIEIIQKDTTGPSPDIAKRLAGDLITRDKVDFLVGFGLTPNALAVAPVATQAKKPMIVMNAATSIITTKSPYIARVSMTLPQVTEPLAQWAFKNGIKKVYTVISDYGPGLDAEAAFTKAFKAAGGEIVGGVRVPLQNPEFAPFVQRAKDAKPEAVFLFLPAGEQGIAFMKTYKERGLAEAGIKLIATGDITDDGVLDAMGDPTLGLTTSFHYSAAHDSAENKAFLKAYADANGTQKRPNFMAAAGYDGMAAIYESLKKTKGSVDADAIMGALKGMKIMSPRGPITIDADTRDVVQTIYIRKVERVNGGLYNVEFDKIADVKDPGK
ncbi:ABC transporter substrate-binding protein [Pigmentiphaga litoralis]|uniref:Branched-chain amino acid transport system substrate-binding protein n=1 Tax=Pigmentiphaga litoralis TaxID=516702 RepID=A0A7Y9ISM3_9BURK|nr:ABC transporter substrate-binding protein [Pigmentiphaga litoralis]NYE24076.1 branched-chain amino acid transport system substrate-binding protein [Pigmentiphaga litoralis]NYE82310.1 branched-chain amino acid transport system substrate-binding protein [Pigmentiphaga litoralis]